MELSELLIADRTDDDYNRSRRSAESPLAMQAINLIQFADTPSNPTEVVAQLHMQYEYNVVEMRKGDSK